MTTNPATAGAGAATMTVGALIVGAGAVAAAGADDPLLLTSALVIVGVGTIGIGSRIARAASADPLGPGLDAERTRSTDGVVVGD